MEDIMLKTALALILTLILFTVAQSDEIHLKDGSIIKGKRVESYSNIGSYDNKVIIENEILGRLEISEDDIKFKDVNLNYGFGLQYTQLACEDDGQFSKNPMFSLSYANPIDNKLSFSYNIGNFYRVFHQKTDMFVETIVGNSSKEGIINSNFEFKSYFITPGIVLRINFLPNVIQKYLDKINLYPYIGIGGGYGLALMKYSREDDTQFTIDGIQYENSDIKRRSHYLGGFHYEGIAGMSLKISKRLTLVGEVSYKKMKFKQFLTKDESDCDVEPKELVVSGISPSIGLRFGLY